MSERSCLVCGCTDARACLEGCSWISDDVDVCDACVSNGMSVKSFCEVIATASEKAAGKIATAKAGLDQVDVEFGLANLEKKLEGRTNDLLRGSRALEDRIRRLEARIPHVVRGRRPSVEQLDEAHRLVDPWILERLVQVLEYLPQPLGDADREKRYGSTIAIIMDGLRRCAGDFKVELEGARLRALAGVKLKRAPRPSAAAAAAAGCRSASSRGSHAPAAPGPRAGRRRGRAASSRKSGAGNEA